MPEVAAGKVVEQCEMRATTSPHGGFHYQRIRTYGDSGPKTPPKSSKIFQPCATWANRSQNAVGMVVFAGKGAEDDVGNFVSTGIDHGRRHHHLVRLGPHAENALLPLDHRIEFSRQRNRAARRPRDVVALIR